MRVVSDGDYPAPGGAQIGESAARIQDTPRRMAEMVQNLLDANRMERGEMRLNLAPA